MKLTLAFLVLASVVIGCALVGSALAADAGPTLAEASAPSSAPAVAEAGDDPMGMIGRLVVATKAGDWREVTGLALVLAVALLLWLARRFGSVGDWIKERDWAGVLVTFATSALGALGMALLGDAPIDLALFRAAFDVGVAAVAGYAVLWKKLVLPLGRWIVGRFRK